MNNFKKAFIYIIALQISHSSATAIRLEQLIPQHDAQQDLQHDAHHVLQQDLQQDEHHDEHSDTDEHQDAAMASFELERELENLQHDFTTILQLCFTPLVLNRSEADQLEQQKILWQLIERKISARIEEAPEEATAILNCLKKAHKTLKYAFLQTQLLTLGKQQSANAIVNNGMNKKEQQSMMLLILTNVLAEAVAQRAVLANSDTYKNIFATAYEATFKGRFAWSELFNSPHNWPNPQELVAVGLGALLTSVAAGKGTDPMVFSTLAAIYFCFAANKPLAGTWRNIKEAVRIRNWPKVYKGEMCLTEELLSTDLLCKQPEIVEAWLSSLQAYQDYTAGNIQQNKKAGVANHNTSLLSIIDENIIIICNRLNGAQDDASRRILRYILSYLSALRLPFYTAHTAADLRTQALKDAFAKHCELIQDDGFKELASKLPELTQRYQTVVELYFQKKPANEWFAHELRAVAQRIAFSQATLSQRFWLKILGRPENQAVQIMTQMIAVLEACEGQNTFFASLKDRIPPGLQDHAVYKFISSAANSDLLPAGGGMVSMYLINRVMGWLSGNKKTAPTNTHIQDLLQLSKEHPLIFSELVKQHPEALEHLVTHFASPGANQAPAALTSHPIAEPATEA
jgi:hypothetical protein